MMAIEHCENQFHDGVPSCLWLWFPLVFFSCYCCGCVYVVCLVGLATLAIIGYVFVLLANGNEFMNLLHPLCSINLYVAVVSVNVSLNRLPPYIGEMRMRTWEYTKIYKWTNIRYVLMFMFMHELNEKNRTANKTDKSIYCLFIDIYYRPVRICVLLLSIVPVFVRVCSQYTDTAFYTNCHSLPCSNSHLFVYKDCTKKM